MLAFRGQMPSGFRWFSNSPPGKLKFEVICRFMGAFNRLLGRQVKVTILSNLEFVQGFM